ncbi:TonB-dependent receptor [Flavobacterium sp. HSC-61S13]|uniref:TonB-dependent receptor n=1 Tax=Flavobacterium sp. HSC-61S13 TaxID=2910963 RepID=UPI00209E98B6|nr:TonB-dependent receptor [Flavobacterium sp. HSC-61S13]MCP1995474.1 hypothetical protein [Flavobacterium sp. HSC-61S13]
MKYFMILFNLMLLGSVTAVSAQNQVYGTLQDIDQQPIDFGEVRLTLKDSENPIQTYSDTLGYFSFNEIPNGLYILEILQLGRLQDQREFYIDKTIDLGTLSINTSSQLSEIVIEGKKKIFETKIDRTVFNVENSIAASTGDALDAIKATPGIAVSNADIKIVGKNSVSVMINDKLVQLSGEDLNNYLKTLSASDIQKIEVITTPPAKYEAQGNGGIINIVLKPKRENAWNNNSRFNYYQASYSNFRIGNTFTYSKDKFSVQAHVDASSGNHSRTERMTNIYPDETWISIDPDKTRTKRLSAKINLDYQLTSKSNIGIQYLNNGYKKKTIWNSAITDIYDNKQQLTSGILTNGHTESEEQFNNLNLNYDFKIDSLGKKISLNLDYFSSDKNNERPFDSERLYYTSSTIPTSIKARSTGDIIIDIYSAKLDFEMPLKAFKLDYGAKVSWIKNGSDSKYFDQISGTPILDPSKSDHFDYSEQGQALYISMNKEWSPKWNSQVGLRMEATQTKGISYTAEQTEKKNFLDFFPTAYIQYKPSEYHAFNLNYNKRISRPPFWALNPFRWYIDAYSYTQGNPFLQPYNTHKLELSYTYKNNWNSKLEYSRVSNAITQIQNVNESDKTRIFTQENFYNIDIYSISQAYTFSKYPWWQSVNTLNISWTRTTFNDDNKQIYEAQNGLNVYISSNNSFKITNKLTAEVNGYINSKSHYMIYVTDPSATLDFGVSYKMIDDNLKMTFNIYDIFRTSTSKSYTQSGTNKIIYKNYYANRYANLAISYSFGNKNIQSKTTKSGNEEERNRL